MAFILVALAFVLAALCLPQIFRLRGQKLPPGPVGYPVVGNLFELSRALRPHLLFFRWSKKYGNIVHFSVFGQSMMIVNDFDIARELLEKRGATYSDRPNMVLENEILGWDAAMPTMRYGNKLRKHRRLSQALLNPIAAKSYFDLHAEVASSLLKALKEQPEKFYDHILVYATSTIFKLAYDLDVTSENHHLVKFANDAVKKSAEAYQASGSLVDFFPSLKWIYTSCPDWTPFIAKLKNDHTNIREQVMKANRTPYQMAKEKIASGNARPSLVQGAIDSLGGMKFVSAEDEHDIQGLAGILYGAGQETTMATLNSFILAMVCFPEVQRNAQREIDAVIPFDRLPNLDDRINLPYMEAFIKELYRWVSPLIINIPHASISDDYYNDYYIPKGTSVIASIYDMLNVCPHPEKFVVDRFLSGTGLGNVPSDPREAVFGFGRRRCPGVHVADNSVWIAVTQMLASFNFLPEVKDGEEQFPALEFGIEMTRHPKRFRCRIEARKERENI
ncbi:cytochrome P450 [Dendrothele bispora CBS 962.96]|uniref:Cytochrome P450 n=1 Tax=Dendrothele bispora (strain CBS 962.96) TaxID=1314807 RepID=A0A4S8MVU0_DENBC|nr:cytochrome P450 [Dendrothele bispora CBS 962.96]